MPQDVERTVRKIPAPARHRLTSRVRLPTCICILRLLTLRRAGGDAGPMDTNTLGGRDAAMITEAEFAASDGDCVRDVVRVLGGDVATIGAMARVPVASRRLHAGTTLAYEGAPLQSLYVVRCGSLKCIRTLECGYEQVTSLSLPGDVVGFDGLYLGHHAVAAVALELSTVYALPLSGLQGLREKCPTLDTALQRALSRQLARAAATADMLAAVASDVRLARFVLWMSARAAELGWSPRRLRLSMCRRDVASLLGVAHETVSRSFTALADAGLLKVANREVEILDPEQLQARARNTRRGTDADPHGSPDADAGPAQEDGPPTRAIVAPRELLGVLRPRQLAHQGWSRPLPSDARP
jgi:CRP/FNR family transcriptional regulator